MKELLGVLGASRLIRHIADGERIPAVALELAPDRADIDEEDIVVLQHDARIGRGAERLQRIGSKAHIDIVPATHHVALDEKVLGHGHGILFHHARLAGRGDRMDGVAGLGPHFEHLILEEGRSDAFQLRLLIEDFGHAEVSC